jgi:hypothetical protein
MQLPVKPDYPAIFNRVCGIYALHKVNKGSTVDDPFMNLRIMKALIQ